MPKQYNSIFSETSDPYETKIDKNIIFSTLKIDSSPTCVESLSWRGVLDTTLCDKVCDLRQVCGFLRVLQFPPLIKLTATI